MNFILILALVAFASSVTNRAVDPMLPAIAVEFDVSLARAAILASVYSFAYALMQLVLGPVGDMLGKSRVIRFSLVMLGAASVLCAMATRFDLIIVGRIVAGAFAGGIIPTSLALIGDRTSPDMRQQALSRIMMASIMGQILGASAAGIIASIVDWRIMFVLAAALTAVAWFFAFFYLKSGTEIRTSLSVHRALGAYRTVLAEPTTLLVFGIVAAEGVFLFGVFPFVAPMLMSRGAAGSLEAGIALAAFAGGGIFYGLAVRRLAAALGQWGMIAAGGSISGMAYLGVAAPLPWTVTVVFFLIAGFGFYMLHNTMQNRASELAPSARGATFALFASSIFLGQAFGPLLAGAVAHSAGFATLFIGAGLLMAASSIAGSIALRRRVARRVDTRERQA